MKTRVPLLEPMVLATVLPLACRYFDLLPTSAVVSYIFGAVGMAFSIEVRMRSRSAMRSRAERSPLEHRLDRRHMAAPLPKAPRANVSVPDGRAIIQVQSVKRSKNS